MQTRSRLRQIIEDLPLFERIFARHRSRLASLINALIQEKGWTQHELAQRMGVRESYISRVLRGSENVTLKTISRLEAAIGESLISIPKAIRKSAAMTESKFAAPAPEGRMELADSSSALSFANTKFPPESTPDDIGTAVTNYGTEYRSAA